MRPMSTASLGITPDFDSLQHRGIVPCAVQIRVQGPGGIPNGAGLVAERSASWQPPAPIRLGPNNGHAMGQVTGVGDVALWDAWKQG